MLAKPLLAVVLLLPAAARAADTLDGLLARGPLVLVETDAKGKFASATGVIAIDAPPDKVWQVITDFARYKEFVPKIVSADVSGTAQAPRVAWEIDTPGFNTSYTVQYRLDPASRTAEGEQVKGDLKGSKWRWTVEAETPTRTLVKYTSVARHFSRILESVEDDQQTITVGVNVGGTLTVLRAVKARCEAKPQVAR